MSSVPLHPAIVHMPLGIAIVLPIVAFGILAAVLKGKLPWRAWLVVFGLQILMLASAFLAIRTGEEDEERVERIVAERAIEAHEAMASQWVMVIGLSLALSLAAVTLRTRRAGRPLLYLAAVATLATAGLAMRLGHAGGELVYVHGAAQAYAQPASADAGGAAPAESTDD